MRRENKKMTGDFIRAKGPLMELCELDPNVVVCVCASLVYTASVRSGKPMSDILKSIAAACNEIVDLELKEKD